LHIVFKKNPPKPPFYDVREKEGKAMKEEGVMGRKKEGEGNGRELGKGNYKGNA
jgi:hypothetical protein